MDNYGGEKKMKKNYKENTPTKFTALKQHTERKKKNNIKTREKTITFTSKYLNAITSNEGQKTKENEHLRNVLMNDW